MKKEIKVARFHANDTSIDLLKWLVKEGDFVKKNQPLAELETSKINIQITTLYAGKITLLKKEGDTLNVGDIIATISK